MLHPAPFLVRLLTRTAGMPIGRCVHFDWPKLIRESGLKVPAIHYSLDTAENDPDKLFAEAEQFKNHYVVIAGIYRFDFTNSEKVRELASRLNRCGSRLKRGGIELLYHNHNIEFLPTDEGPSAYDILLKETDPDAVNFETDFYWAADAGIGVRELLEKTGERMKLCHISDRGNREAFKSIKPIVKMENTELGRGSLDLKAVIEAAKAWGTEAVILEMTRNHLHNNPIESAEVSAEWLRQEL